MAKEPPPPARSPEPWASGARSSTDRTRTTRVDQSSAQHRPLTEPKAPQPYSICLWAGYSPQGLHCPVSLALGFCPIEHADQASLFTLAEWQATSFQSVGKAIPFISVCVLAEVPTVHCRHTSLWTFSTSYCSALIPLLSKHGSSWPLTVMSASPPPPLFFFF